MTIYTALPQIKDIGPTATLRLYARAVDNLDNLITGNTTFTIKHLKDGNTQYLTAPDGTTDATLIKGDDYQINYTNPEKVYDEWTLASKLKDTRTKILLTDWDGNKTNWTPQFDTTLNLTKINKIDGEPIIQTPPNTPYTHYTLGKRELRLILGGGNGLAGVLMKYANPLNILERENTGGVAPIGLARARDVMDFLVDQSRGHLNINYHDASTQLPTTNYLQTLIDPTDPQANNTFFSTQPPIVDWGQVRFRSDTQFGLPVTWDALGEEYLQALTIFQDVRIPSPTTPGTTIKASQRFFVFQAVDQPARIPFSRAGDILYKVWNEFPAGTKFWNLQDLPF